VLRCDLSWERNLLALHDFGDVQIEEVAVENGLNDAGKDGNQIEMILIVITVDPVGDVQRAVAALGEQVVGCDCLGLARLDLIQLITR